MAKWSDNKRSAEVRHIDRGQYMSLAARNAAWVERGRIMRLIQDTDLKAKRVRDTITYPEPVGGMREARKCSWCREPTIFTTPRGRSVHPTCEGWVDDLTDRGAVELIYSLSDVLGIKSVEVGQP